MELLQFPITIRHTTPGKENAIADALSRIGKAGNPIPTGRDVKVIVAQELEETILNDPEKRAALILSTHNVGHLGIERTMLKLERFKGWPDLKEEVKTVISNCQQCKRDKRRQGAYQTGNDPSYRRERNCSHGLHWTRSSGEGRGANISYLL